MTTANSERIFQQLDAPCSNCDGTGNVSPKQGLYRACDVCYGTGYQPTQAGVELLNFLRRQRKRIERERV